MMEKIEDYDLYKRAEFEVSNKHSIKCICGRLCTGLHESQCGLFRKAVYRKYLSLMKKSKAKK